MIREDLESREAEIIRTISMLPRGFIVIGGYAVGALSIHRFSVDCDMIIPAKDAEKFRAELKKQGYRKEKSAKGFDEEYQSEVEIYAKDAKSARVSVDLFVNGVTSRKTKGSWSYEYARENSADAIVSGARNSAGSVVPTKELLMAMKIHSGRDVDMRDIVMLSEGVDWDLVLRHSARGERDVLVKQLTDMISRMSISPRYGVTVSRGVSGFRVRPTPIPIPRRCAKSGRGSGTASM